MGCSMTEGHGCYDLSLINLEDFPDKSNANSINIKPHLERFHEYGWPNRVGRKLGFNKVINLGRAGSSNSFHLTIFLHTILPQLRQLRFRYNEIKVIWMMTDPYRATYLGEKTPINLSPLNYTSELDKNLMEFFLENQIIPERNQAFLMQQSEFIFNQLEIDFLFTSWNNSFLEVYNHFKTDHYLSPVPDYIRQSSNPILQSKICKHPNEDGYEHMSEEIVKRVRKFKPHFDMGTVRGSCDWEHIKFNTNPETPLKSYGDYFVI